MNLHLPTQWRERIASPLTWHIAGFAMMLTMFVVLAIILAFDMAGINGRSVNSLSGKQVEFKVLDMQMAPLRGIEKRLSDSKAQMQAFYAKRIPANYSSIATRIG